MRNWCITQPLYTVLWGKLKSMIMDNSPDAIVINLLKYILYTYKTIVLESITTSLFDLIVGILFLFCLKANSTAHRIMLNFTNCRYIQFSCIPMSITLLKTVKLYKMLTLIIKALTYTYCVKHPVGTGNAIISDADQLIWSTITRPASK